MSGFSIHDLRFRRRSDDECDIVVYGQTVGTVMRRPDIANPDGGRFYVIHLYDDRRGPKQIDDREQVRSAIASHAGRARSRAFDAAAGASGLRGPPAASHRLSFSLPPLGSGPPSRFDGDRSLFSCKQVRERRPPLRVRLPASAAPLAARLLSPDRNASTANHSPPVGERHRRLPLVASRRRPPQFRRPKVKPSAQAPALRSLPRRARPHRAPGASRLPLHASCPSSLAQDRLEAKSARSQAPLRHPLAPPMGPPSPPPAAQTYALASRRARLRGSGASGIRLAGSSRIAFPPICASSSHFTLELALSCPIAPPKAPGRHDPSVHSRSRPIP